MKYLLPILFLFALAITASASELSLANTETITPTGINLSYIDGSPENRDGPYAGLITSTTSGNTITSIVTGTGTDGQRLYGTEQLTSQSFRVGDTLSVTLKASPCLVLSGEPALARFTIASDWNDNYYLSNPSSSIDISNGTNGWETFSITLNPANFTVWPVGNTGIGFANTIANAGVVGIDFLAAGATGTSSDYNSNGQLPSYGTVGNVSIEQCVVTPEPSTFILLAVAGAIAAIVWVIRRRKVAV